MKASKGNKKNKRIARRVTDKNRNSRKQILPALMAVGGACGMLAVPASALELGNIKIDSSLGQPLRASIAYALNPNEALYDFCVYLRPGLAANGLPVLSKATVSIANGTILLTGSRAIREPLLTMQVSIDCPYTAHLSREYTLMIDPPVPVIREEAIVVEPTAATEPRPAPITAPKPRPAVESRGNLDRSPISESSRYLVQRGDSLSEIASRISNRSIALWPAVDRIFAANPDAFMDGDMNRLKAGSWLDIPDLSAAAQQAIAGADPTVTTAQTSESGKSAAYTGIEATAPAATIETITAANPAEVPVTTDVTEAEEPFVTEPAADDSEFANLRPGDVVVSNDSPFVSPLDSEADATESIIIPDTEIIEPATQPVPVLTTGQSSDSADSTSGSWSWFVWLGGTGLALILGLLLFGQRFRQRFGSVAVGATSGPLPKRRSTDVSSQTAEASADVEFQIPDASPHSAYMTLDADFDDGSGLQDAADMDLAQDFGFSASTTFEEELDMVLPEVEVAEETAGPTDIIPPSEREADPSILDSEVMPSEEDDADYDLSMIIDVTKQDVVESDATEKDLQAVQVDSENEPPSDDYTLSQDVDYKILEQDYEDEFTATQALNAEIEKAAAELADRMDNDATGEMTANLPENTQAVNDDVNDSGTTAEVPAELAGSDDNVTVEMPVDDNEVTVDLEVESGMVDTKRKKKAS